MTGRYDELPKMSLRDLEAELNFYQWLEDEKGTMDTDIIANKMWLDTLWIEVERRGYNYEKKIILMEKESNEKE